MFIMFVIPHRSADGFLILLVFAPPPPPSPSPSLPAPDRSGHRRPSPHNSRSQWAAQDLNRQFPIPLGIAGPQPPAPYRSGHRRTSTSKVPIAVGTRRASTTRKNVELYARQNVRKYVRHKARMFMSDRMPDRLLEKCQLDC